MADTLTLEETRRLIKKLRARVFLTVTQADDLLRLCDGLDIAEEMAEALRDGGHTGKLLHCIGCKALAKWAERKGS